MINAKIIKEFNPCIDGYKNYFEVFGDKDISWYEFLTCEQIPVKDRHWLINREWGCMKMQRIQRDYALICAARVVEKCDVQEVKDFFDIVIAINVSEDFDLKEDEAYSAAYRAANSAANRAAYRAAYWAANSAANRKIQLKIFLHCLNAFKTKE